MSINELKARVESLEEELSYHVEELADVEKDLCEALDVVEHLANRVKHLETILGGKQGECTTPN